MIKQSWVQEHNEEVCLAAHKKIKVRLHEIDDVDVRGERANAYASLLRDIESRLASGQDDLAITALRLWCFSWSLKGATEPFARSS
jgi:hypothetical protein